MHPYSIRYLAEQQSKAQKQQVQRLTAESSESQKRNDLRTLSEKAKNKNADFFKVKAEQNKTTIIKIVKENTSISQGSGLNLTQVKKYIQDNPTEIPGPPDSSIDPSIHGQEDAYAHFRLDQDNKQRSNVLYDPSLIANCLSCSFLLLEHEINVKKIGETRDQNNNDQFYYSGSTLTVVLKIYDSNKKNYQFITANVGDSNAVIFKQNLDSNSYQAFALNKVHHPTIEEEKTRIERSGGTVFRGRVRNYAVSRSLGDARHTENLIIPEPEISILELSENDDFVLVVASDGYWDVENENDTAETLTTAINVDNTADSLRNEAFSHCAVDDTTVMVSKKKPISEVFVLADGHAGNEVSQYCAENFERIYQLVCHYAYYIRMINNENSDVQVKYELEKFLNKIMFCIEQKEFGIVDIFSGLLEKIYQQKSRDQIVSSEFINLFENIINTIVYTQSIENYEKVISQTDNQNELVDSIQQIKTSFIQTLNEMKPNKFEVAAIYNENILKKITDLKFLANQTSTLIRELFVDKNIKNTDCKQRIYSYECACDTVSFIDKVKKQIDQFIDKIKQLFSCTMEKKPGHYPASFFPKPPEHFENPNGTETKILVNAIKNCTF